MSPIRHILRFTRRLFVASLSGILIFAAAITLFWLLMGGWVGQRLSSFANQRLFTDRTTRLTVGRVTGSVFTDVTLEDVRLERRVGAEWRSVVHAPEVEARYDLWGLIRGRTELKAIRIRRPLIEISQDPSGRWVLPVGNVPGERERGGDKRVRLDQVSVEDGRLHLIGLKRGWEADSLSVRGSVDVLGAKGTIDVTQAAFRVREPIGRIEDLSGRLTIDGARIEGADLRLLWEGSSVRGNFRVEPSDSVAGLDASFQMRDIPLGRLRSAVEASILPRSGHVGGFVHLSGSFGAFDFEANLSGRYENRRVDTLSVAGRRDGSRIRVDRLKVVMPEMDLASGSGRLDLAGGGRIEAGLQFNHLQVDSIPLKAVRWIPGVGRGRLDLDVTNFKRGGAPLAAVVDLDFAGEGQKAFGVTLLLARGHADYEEKRDLRLTDVTLVLPDGGTVTGQGLVHPGDVLDIDFVAESNDWSALRPVIAIPGLGGSGRAVGRLVGTGHQPAVEVSGDFTRVTGWQMAADSVRLVKLAGPFSPEPEFEGTVTAEGLHGLGRIIDHVEMDFHWRDPRLTFSRLHAVDQDTVVVTEGWADFDARRNAMTVTLPKGSLGIGVLTWIPEAPVVVVGAGNRYDVKPVRYHSAAGSAEVGAFFDNDAGTMDARFTGMKIDLAVMAGERKAPEFGGGTLEGDLRLAGAVSLPDPSGRLVIRDYRWADATIDSALIDFRGTGSRVDVTEGWADSGPGRLSFQGGVSLPDKGWTIWNKWTSQKPVAWERVGLDQVEIRSDGADLSRWAAWNPDLKGIRGSGRGRIRLSGLLNTPRFQSELRFIGLAQGRYSADTLDVTADYASDRLQVTQMRVVRLPAISILSGDLPLDLSIYPPKATVLEKPMDLRLDLKRADLTLLPLFAKGIEQADGNLSGTLRVGGTPRHYLAFGELKLKDGLIRLKDREEVIEGIEAQVTVDSTTVNLVSLLGREAGGGTLSGRGTFELGVSPERAYKLELDLKDFVVRQSADYAARFNGHFEVVPLALADGTVQPMTQGDVTVSRAEIVRQFDQPMPVEEPGRVFYYSITIDAPRQVFIVNDVVDMELRGTLTARRTPQRSELIGDLEILHGYYNFLLQRFRITDGRLSFNKLDVIDPAIDITAQTNAAEYVITVHITGQASNPVIQFSAKKPREEEPAALSEEEILRLLAPGGALAGRLQGVTTGPGTTELGVDVLTRSVQLLLSQVQRDVARKLGFDEVRLDSPDAGDLGSYGKVSVSKWVTPNVSVSYSQGLSSYLEQDLSVEYRLGRLLFLRGEILRRRSFEQEYNVDLRFFHEY